MIEALRKLRAISPIARSAHKVLRDPYYRVLTALYPHGIQTKLADGTRVRVHPRYLGLRPEVYEQALVHFLLSHLRPGAFVIDVGAHVGFHTLLFSAHVGPAGRVLACEASPANAVQLRRHIIWNRCTNVEVVEAAISDRLGTVNFTYRPDPTDPGAFANSLAYDIQGVATQICATTLDTIIVTRAPDLIKIDVEGSELLVLRGARETLAGSAPILVVAVHPEPMKLMGTTPRELVEFMDAMGYDGYHLDGRRATDPGFEEVIFEKRHPAR